MIELDSVTKLYGTVIGINDVCLSLEPGSYGLVGPNGSGKTTLVNLITGQLRPTMGEVRVFGDRPWNRRSLLGRLGLCPAVDVLYPNVSAFDWVTYLTTLHGFSPAEAARRTEDALERTGMAQAMHRTMGTYSLGMRQRTKLAQAFAHDPDLLILDEPFNGLDPIGRKEMTELLNEWTSAGRSLLLASHVLHEVEAISPAFLLILGGRILASGSADEVHAMLVDVPNEIQIECDRPTPLAQHLIQQEGVDSVQLDRHGGTLRVGTRQPLAIYERLPGWVDELGVEVHQLRSSDASLQSLFTTLMRIHRGERE